MTKPNLENGIHFINQDEKTVGFFLYFEWNGIKVVDVHLLCKTVVGQEEDLKRHLKSPDFSWGIYFKGSLCKRIDQEYPLRDAYLDFQQNIKTKPREYIIG